MPPGPSSSNRSNATAAPHCTETIDARDEGDRIRLAGISHPMRVGARLGSAADGCRSAATLDPRELNRATLARQRLLERNRMTAFEAVEHSSGCRRRARTART